MHPLRVLIEWLNSRVRDHTTGPDFSTPEGAFLEHKRAWIAKDVSRYLDTIVFVQGSDTKAESALPSHSADSKPSDLTEEEEEEKRKRLRIYLESTGFKPDVLTRAKVITRWNDSENRVRLPVQSRDRRGSTTYVVQLIRRPEGWRIARDYAPDA